jgi:YHS domain-containing protein
MKHSMLKNLLLLASVAGSQLMPTAAYGQGAGHDTAKAQMTQPGSSTNKSDDGLAVKGYDVVAYFTEKQPLRGNPQYSYEYKGAIYDFVSAGNRDLFAKNPEAYLPQYGGYCTVGTSMGHKADIDPESWAVIDGKLYLNSSREAQKLFDKDPQSAIKKADRNWAKLK